MSPTRPNIGQIGIAEDDMIPCQTLLADLSKIFPKMIASFYIIFFFQELGSSTLDARQGVSPKRSRPDRE